MLDCWQENPEARPTFASLRDTLKEMERNRVVSMKRIPNLNFSCWLICYDKDTVHFCQGYKKESVGKFKLDVKIIIYSNLEIHKLQLVYHKQSYFSMNTKKDKYICHFSLEWG